MAEALYNGTGRRKTAVARVRVLPGDGKITVNGRDVDEYFPRPAYRTAVRSPLELLGSASRYEIIAKIEGGGPTGQAEALRHGIARALADESQEARSELKAAALEPQGRIFMSGSFRAAEGARSTSLSCTRSVRVSGSTLAW
jgi:small subunit ribosomal protein S9